MRSSSCPRPPERDVEAGACGCIGLAQLRALDCAAWPLNCGAALLARLAWLKSGCAMARSMWRAFALKAGSETRKRRFTSMGSPPNLGVSARARS